MCFDGRAPRLVAYLLLPVGGAGLGNAPVGRTGGEERDPVWLCGLEAETNTKGGAKTGEWG